MRLMPTYCLPERAISCLKALMEEKKELEEEDRREAEAERKREEEKQRRKEKKKGDLMHGLCHISRQYIYISA